MEDDSVLDMEQIREEMKLVPLPEMCYNDIGADGCFQSMNDVDFESSFDDVEPERPFRDDDRAQQAESREANRTCAVSGALEAEEGPPPDFSLWTVEDDLLLKNAVEAGAAMEALARGAMRFSRRYTVRELRERWRALLFDPEISSKASERMVEAEAAFLQSLRLMFPSKQKFQDFVRKRRQKSVRATYYRKKRCIEDDKVWEHQAAGQDGEGFAFDDDAFSQMVNLLAMGGVEAVIEDAFLEEDKGPLQQVSSPSKLEQFTPAEDMPEVSCQEKPNISQVCEVQQQQDQQQDQQQEHRQGAEGDKVRMGNGVAEADNAKVSSALFEGNNDADDCQVLTKPPLEVFLLSSDEEDMDEDSSYYSSSPTAKRLRLSSAVVHENLTCTLNTEETEVPEFDDFISSPSSSRHQGPTSPDDFRGGYFWSQSEASSDREQEPLSYPRRAAEAPKEDRHLSLPSDNLCFKISLSGKRFDSSKGKPAPYQTQPARKTEITSSHQQQPRVSSGSRFMSSSSLATPLSTSAPPVVKTASAMTTPRIFSTETEPSANCKVETADPDGATATTGVNDSSLGVPPNGILEEQAVDEIESDDEVASFSDLEALVLDMDLDPGDDDVSARAESKLRYRQHRRTLLRLEQCANASMQRSLLLRGAIAILYGHKLRYLITKDEVSLGRATGDNAVDIDLAQEGVASKVSRQQASIKLKEDGVFYLKNLGRRLLHVNDVAVATGQHISLTSNCLIEVGGMAFIFDTNKKLVQQRVKDILAAQQQQQQQHSNVQ